MEELGFWDSQFKYKRDQYAAAKTRESLGSEGYADASFRSAEFDENGNEINVRTNNDTGAYGLLADKNINPSRMRFAADQMEVGNTSLANNIIAQETGNALNIDNSNRDQEILKKNAADITNMIMGQRPSSTPQQPRFPQMAGVQPQPVQAVNNSANPTPLPNLPQYNGFNPPANTNGSPQPISPLRTAPIKPNDPMISTLPTGYNFQPEMDRKSQERSINAKYRQVALMPGANPAVVENMRKAEIDALYGSNNTNLYRTWKDAQADGYKGSLEEWKKAGNKIMTGDGTVKMLSPEQKTQMGLLGANGQPTDQPLYVTSKGDIKAAPVKPVDTSERTSEAYSAMMGNLTPELQVLAPVTGYDMDLLRQEASEMLNWLPMNLSNAVNSGKGQKREAAQNAWLNANGRDESGATIKDEEMDKYRSYYFTRLGDKPETIAFKATLRKQAVEGMRMKAGKASGSAGNAIDPLISEYKLIASSNKIVYENHDDKYIYGRNKGGQLTRVPIPAGDK